MCLDCGCGQTVPFGIKFLRAVAPGLLRAHTVAPPAEMISHHPDRPAPEVPRVVDVRIPLLQKNDRLAARNRDFFRERGLLALNFVSSAGAGKTTLLARTLDELGHGTKCAVVVGDLETDNDARRLARPYAMAVQITTGTACHLDADMVGRSLEELDLTG